MNSPLLSVVIPTRNRREMALQAARSALEPLPFPVEVLLSDNASTDGTPELAGLLPGVRYVRRASTIPMAEHWNLCVREARGKYVKVLCDDDWLIPGALEREVQALEGDPGLALAASTRTEVTPEGREKATLGFAREELRLAGQPLFWRMLLWENIFGPPTSVTFRRSAFRAFPSGYQYAADFACWVRLAGEGGAVFLPEPGAKIRLHAANLTLRHVDEDTDFLEVQALRHECALRLRGASRLLAPAVFLAIWGYRFSRRLARYVRLGRPSGVFRFLARVASYRRPRIGD
jgi:glycosyltransferase involved in cell wall biosynthesis